MCRQPLSAKRVALLLSCRPPFSGPFFRAISAHLLQTTAAPRRDSAEQEQNPCGRTIKNMSPVSGFRADSQRIPVLSTRKI
jgi:hypothetical protein